MVDADRVLVIEDEPDLRTLVRVVLERAGYRVDEASDGTIGIRIFHELRPDLVLLDLSLPGLSGWQVLERIREMSSVPVIVITARALEADKVRGLDSGADDYLTKPFGLDELTARVRAALRRTGPTKVTSADRFIDARLELDHVPRTVRWDGEEVRLTPTEYRLLAALVRHCDHVLSSDQLLELAWDDPFGVGPDRVKHAVMRLRRKLGGDDRGSPIEAVRGFGYRYRRITSASG